MNRMKSVGVSAPSFHKNAWRNGLLVARRWGWREVGESGLRREKPLSHCQRVRPVCNGQ